MELFVMIFEYVIDPDSMIFPYYLLMIHPRLRNLLTQNIFRSVYVTRVPQNQLYVNPFFSFLRNITCCHASYAHWDNADITSVCNFVKRKLHPSIISFYLRESVRLLEDPEVVYYKNGEEGVRCQHSSSF